MDGVSVVSRTSTKVKKKVKSVTKKLNQQQQMKTPSPQQKQMKKKIKLTSTMVNGDGGVASASKLSSNNNAVDCLDGMSAAELAMVRRLAGNDPVARKKTLRKLKKWLSVLSQKVPDSPDSRSMIEPNFIRVWKALFYCMWMADKPLPQEQLAESIADLQNIFATKAAPFLLFVEWFIRTIAREWSWIDRFRMDKFMMLFRRFLRKTLVVISENKWQNDMLEGYMKIISTYIFNRHPSPKSKKQVAKQAPIAFAPLGLQIHFTDIFMEELAKVGGENMKFQKILKVLTIFMNELGYSNDDRLLGEIRERIFNHLMRQSDVGIDYQEEMTHGGVGVEEVEDEEAGDSETSENLGEEDQFLEDEAENDTAMESNGVLDPRAGAVDVILPQLDVDYDKLYQKLIEFGGQKEVKLKNRRILYSLASQFKELTEGKYPLALPQEDSKKPAISRKEVRKAAQELLESELDETSGKRRKTKKQRRRELKKMQQLNQSADSVGSEDNSKYIQDEELLDHVTDNYMSYLEDEVVGKEDEDETELPVENDHVEETIEEEKEKSAVKKSKKRKWKTVVEVEADEVEASKPAKLAPVASPKEKKEEVIIVKRPRKRLSLVNNATVAAASTPVLKGKVRRLTELVRTPINSATAAPSPSSLTKSANKRVSFVLNRNLEHDHADYPVSIARSPAIPYDKHRRPSVGLLKSPLGTPSKSTPIRRAAALDFF